MTGRSAKRTGSRFQCPVCLGHFAGAVAYGNHFGAENAECLSADELRLLGMTLTDAGFWTMPRAIASGGGYHHDRQLDGAP